MHRGTVDATDAVTNVPVLLSVGVDIATTIVPFGIYPRKGSRSGNVFAVELAISSV